MTKTINRTRVEELKEHDASASMKKFEMSRLKEDLEPCRRQEAIILPMLVQNFIATLHQNLIAIKLNGTARFLLLAVNFPLWSIDYANKIAGLDCIATDRSDAKDYVGFEVNNSPQDYNIIP